MADTGPSHDTDAVVAVLKAVGRVPDTAALQAAVLVAQKLGLTHSRYAFSFDRNLPFCENLSADVEWLICQRDITDTGTGNSLFVAEHVTLEPSVALRRLSSLGPGAMMTLARLLDKVDILGNYDSTRELDLEARTLLAQRIDRSCLEAAMEFLKGVQETASGVGTS